MKTSGKKLAGLRRHHANRIIKTRSQLLEALDRMESGNTVVVPSGFDWSKMTLAREAGVNINTVVRKMRSGEWAFPEVNDRFEMLKQKRVRVKIAPDAKKQRIIELRREVEKLRKENRKLALEVPYRPAGLRRAEQSESNGGLRAAEHFAARGDQPYSTSTFRSKWRKGVKRLDQPNNADSTTLRLVAIFSFRHI